MHRAAVFGAIAISISGCASISDSEYGNSKSEYYKMAKIYVDSVSAAHSKSYPGWQNYGDWHVQRVSGDLSATSSVKLFTVVNNSSNKYLYSANEIFGLEILDGELVVVSPPLGFAGKSYWPFCDLNASTVSVDGDKAFVLNDKKVAGVCDSVDPSGVGFNTVLSGKKARVRFGRVDGDISLDGFKEAWDEGLKLAK